MTREQRNSNRRGRRNRMRSGKGERMTTTEQ